MSKKVIISWIVYFALMLLASINYIVFKLLDLEPRTWLTAIVWILIVLVPFVLIFFMLKGTFRLCKTRFARGFIF